MGKTSFIRYLLGRDFPGARIGPEPTTDRFNAVMHGAEDRIIPGNALAVDPSMPFSSLTMFGTEFLNKFQSSTCNSPVLEKVFFVDTPGVLSGEKQKLGRAYDFVKVTEWFAQRADLILLLFDAHKLDISDEFQAAIKALRGQDDKIRVVLNKADKVCGLVLRFPSFFSDQTYSNTFYYQVTSQQLMRVYGAMMWSLGKVVNTPEVMRVYIGSFWDGPCMNPDLEAFFKAEQSDLLRDLHELPRNAAVRKVNELVKRARMARVHALIIGHLKAQMPFFGSSSKQKELIAKMADEFFAVMKKHRLPQGDFPNLARFQEVAATYEFARFQKLNEKMIATADDALSNGIPSLLRQLAEEQDAKAAKDRSMANSLLQGGDGISDSAAGNPFGGVGVGGSDPTAIWAQAINKTDADSVFKMLPGGQQGKVSGIGAKDLLLESGLTTEQLRLIWDLSDIDADGFLDVDEFAVCWYLLNMAKEGRNIPSVLPNHLCPPSKRKM